MLLHKLKVLVFDTASMIRSILKVATKRSYTSTPTFILICPKVMWILKYWYVLQKKLITHYVSVVFPRRLFSEVSAIKICFLIHFQSWYTETCHFFQFEYGHKQRKCVTMNSSLAWMKRTVVSCCRFGRFECKVLFIASFWCDLIQTEKITLHKMYEVLHLTGGSWRTRR